MREPAVRKTLYWCEKCNVPLLGRRCACGAEGKAIPLLRPYDARPALAADRGIITGLLRQHFGTESLPSVVILNKTSGRDRNDLIIANGDRFGWLSFDPSSGKYSLELEFGAVPWLLASATRGVIDLTSVGGAYRDVTQGKRIGGKKYPAPVDLPEGPVLMTWEGHAAVGTCRAGSVKVREAGRYIPATYPDPGWDRVISSSISTLKNLERSAIRFIRHHAGRASCVAVSFSGGKDSTVTMELARRAGYGNAFFVDTGMEFPETLGFVRSLGIENILHAKDFWREIEKNGPPHKDDRWCCERQKLAPVKEWLKGKGECITVQGNRWYESFARSGLPPVARNPYYPLQVNISPIRNWRALEVFLYTWWRKIPQNPLYELGFERVGCWMCPAMLGSEWERVRVIHPDLYETWMEFLVEWGRRKGMDKEAVLAGAWRWKRAPPKMRGG